MIKTSIVLKIAWNSIKTSGLVAIINTFDRFNNKNAERIVVQLIIDG